MSTATQPFKPMTLPELEKYMGLARGFVRACKGLDASLTHNEEEATS